MNRYTTPCAEQALLQFSSSHELPGERTPDEDSFTEYHQALTDWFEGAERGSLADIAEAQKSLEKSRRALGWVGHDLLSLRRIRELGSSLKAADAVHLRSVGCVLQSYLNTQCQLMSIGSMSVHEFATTSSQLADLELELDTLLDVRWRRIREAFVQSTQNVVVALDQALALFGRVSVLLEHYVPSGSGRIARGTARAIGLYRSFFSHEALRATALETSWGIRTYLPGTYGTVGNVGPWVMFYSGSVAQYGARAVPMRVNPGMTFATPIWVATANRPGLGAGASLPFVSTYLDKARYKLLLGLDGVGYVRIGEWFGRGPYFTVSASIPIWIGVSVTWNVSLFSPGFAPLVIYSTPLAEKMRRWTGAMVRRAKKVMKLG